MLSISEKLKQARLAENLTQEELAEKLGVSRQTISNWENGRSYPDIVSIITLSDVYDMTLDSLLKGDKEMIKHLKVSTDTVKSNRHLIIGLIAFGFFCMAGFAIRDFAPGLRIDNLIMNSLTLIGLLAATIVAITKSIDFIKSAELRSANKTLTVIGIIALNAFVYTSLILLIPAYVIYKRLRCLLST